MIKFPEYKEISQFNEVFDLYICALGFEDRSLGSNLVLLEKSFRTKKTLVVKYDSYKEENEKNKQDLELIWKKFSNDFSYVDYPSDDRKKAIQNLVNALRSTSADVKNVVINISSFKTHLQTWLLNFAFETFDSTKIIYSEPEEYGDQSKSDKAYASGVKEIFTMEDFSGALLPGYSSLLIIFLGYDFVRAGGTYEHIQPSKKIGIMGKPNTASLIERFHSIKTKHELSFSSTDEIKEFSIFDLDSLMDYLVDVRAKNIEKCNISIALNGSKLHSIGALLFAKKYRDIQVIMSSPISYHPTNFSKGINKTFEIDIEKSWIKEFLKN